MKRKIFPAINLLFCIAMIGVNALANILPINGYNTGQVSALYPNRFVPAGFTFGIWTVIYLLLTGFVVASIVWTWRKPQSDGAKLVRLISPIFWASCVLNASWILSWHYLQIGLSVLIMLLFLALLLWLYLILQPKRKTLSAVEQTWFYQPFVVYLGWISVATIANIAAWLVAMKWWAWGIDPSIWTMVLIVVATLLALVFVYRQKDPAYAIVIAWAIYGIYSRQAKEYPEIGLTTLVCQVTLMLFIVYRVFVRRQRVSKPTRLG